MFGFLMKPSKVRFASTVIARIGRDINEEMVRAGLAWWYRQYAHDDQALSDAENEARSARRGLWQDADPVPPWDWRRQRRTEASAAD